MRTQRFQMVFTAVVMAQLLLTAQLWADNTVAFEDFDGGQVNLISSSVTNLDGGIGDFFGVASLGAWPQVGSGPSFSIADDSVADVSGDGAFAGDTEGLFGQNRNPNDHFFALSDTREWDSAQRTASWTFDISGATGLKLSIDMGAQANDNFGGFGLDAEVTFTYQIDGGPVVTAFSVKPNSDFGDYSYRAMDVGTIPPVGSVGPLEVTGDNSIAKTLADSGLLDSNTFLNKTPADGIGAGLMDTFTTSLDGTGSQLVLTMTAHMPNEAMAFDNIKITGVPEPGTVALIGMGATVCFAANRCRMRRGGATCMPRPLQTVRAKLWSR